MDGYEVLWGARPAPRRGPKPALSLEGIARTGIELADAEGLAAVSMQRVAAELGFTKMSLYRYVPGKAELVALMADLAMGAPPELDGGWRERLDAWARALLPRFTQHPWVLEATTGPRVPGPNELAWTEAAVAALGGTGLRGSERLDAVVVLVGHVRGIAQQAAATSAESVEQQFSSALITLLREHGDRYPSVAAALTDTAGQDEALDFGLARILDGLTTLIATRAT
ncbi:regulatory protein, tetR family [Saccharopolyspora antimicrobica]|uniref:Regulatory protein, tetR family n=1 Tax=Saccharopolyspora antimicrobica TaxID=455193 RepID=A0A1I4XGM0_9PSEU|nr:TetR/AcrR family transcriptional regulator [Saccharopolyspora antimicrobica]RKT84505.1 TetR family transcriptional regulator [Saccharopolyspora antimicrobica]SFN25044.1 regulatory protein, tetR family [Saccharopolyspora antimicrobica]